MRFSTMIVAPAAVAAMQSAGMPSGAPSGTPVVGVSTLYSTQTITITSCLPTVTDCPVRSSTIVVPVGTTTTTAYVVPSASTTTTAVLVPSSSAPVCVPSTVTSYVTVCPSVPATSIPATSIPATSIPASSKPASSVPATSVPATSVPSTTKGVAQSTTAYVPKNTTVPYMQANAGTTVQAGSAAIIALAGVVAFFL